MSLNIVDFVKFKSNILVEKANLSVVIGHY